MIIRGQLIARAMFALVLAAFATANCATFAQAQIQDQWHPVERTLSDFVSDGFAIETILFESVTAVSVRVTVYYLRRENVLARCTETVTRKRGAIATLSVGCAELGKPVVK